MQKLLDTQSMLMYHSVVKVRLEVSKRSFKVVFVYNIMLSLSSDMYYVYLFYERCKKFEANKLIATYEL